MTVQTNEFEYIVYKDYTEDGVIGLKARQYLLDARGDVLAFKSYTDAQLYLEDAGVDYENDELMQIVKCRCHSMPLPEEESCLCELGTTEEDTRSF